MLKLSALALMATIAAPLSAMAYTQQDADACTPDAMRLCSQSIPDANRVAQCLVQKKRQLSLACSVVFSRPRAASATAERPATFQNTSTRGLY
jgi:hypothetical protein